MISLYSSRISLFKNYMHFFTYPYVSGYVTPTYALRFQVDSSGVTNYGSGTQLITATTRKRIVTNVVVTNPGQGYKNKKRVSGGIHCIF